MTTAPYARLHERLGRLERQQGIEGSTPNLPRPLLHALLQALAVRLGGYPLLYEVPRGRDTLGDGFARALGYVDREAMGDAAQRDPKGWSSNLGAAVERLMAGLGVAGDTATREGGRRTWEAILNVCAASKVQGYDDAAERDALMGWFGAHEGRVGLEGRA